MALKLVKPGGMFWGYFATSDGSALVDADSLPIGTLTRNAADDGAVVPAVVNVAAGWYAWTASIPLGYAAGDRVAVRIAYAVNGQFGLYVDAAQVTTAADVGPLPAAAPGSDGGLPLANASGRVGAEVQTFAAALVDPNGYPNVSVQAIDSETGIAVALANWMEFAGVGIGDTPVNHDTGGTDHLRYTHGGSGIGGATVRAYLDSEYAANNLTERGTATTGDDGRWVAPMFLTHGLVYAFVFSKRNAYQATAVRGVTV